MLMPELTPELIADLAAPMELQLSPDGRRVAYALVPASKPEEYSASAIWIADVDGARPPRQFTAGTAADRRPLTTAASARQKAPAPAEIDPQCRIAPFYLCRD